MNYPYSILEAQISLKMSQYNELNKQEHKAIILNQSLKYLLNLVPINYNKLGIQRNREYDAFLEEEGTDIFI